MFQYKEYSLELKEPFGTAHGIRERTDGMLVALKKDDVVGYGEVFMPPYYPENQATMRSFFEMIDEDALLSPGILDDALDYVDSVASANRAAKAALDIALHDLHGKLNSKPYLDFYPGFEGIEDIPESKTSYTIGFDTVDKMVAKAVAARQFQILKIKLKGENDVDIIRKIASETKGKRLYVDVNQGWDDVDKAIETAKTIIELGVRLIEQPFPTGRLNDVRTLGREISVPLVADEDLQTVDQLQDLAASYDGVNIKFMKAGGIRPSIRLFSEAKRLGLKILLGCMTESSIGISAAAQMSAAAEWCDLDGNLLIKNDTCVGVITEDDNLVNSKSPGIGISDDTFLREFFG